MHNKKLGFGILVLVYILVITGCEMPKILEEQPSSPLENTVSTNLQWLQVSDDTQDPLVYKLGIQSSNSKFTIGDFSNPYLFVARYYDTQWNDTEYEFTATLQITDNTTHKILYNESSSSLVTKSSTSVQYIGIGPQMTFEEWNAIPDGTSLQISASLLYNDFQGTGDQVYANDSVNVVKASAKEIYTWFDLEAISHNLSGHYAIQNDITRPSYGVGLEGFIPIGFQGEVAITTFPGISFTGTLDGQGFTIHDLVINKSESSYVGLFDKIDASAYTEKTTIVQNLTINATIQGNTGVGALAGYIKGSRNTYFTNIVIRGNVTGVKYTGGIVGINDGAIIAGNIAGNTTGNEITGGLVGHNMSDGVVYGYMRGNVVSTGATTGGSVGLNEGVVIGYLEGNVQSPLDINGGTIAGGVVGRNHGIVVGYEDANVIGIDSGEFIADNQGTAEGYWTTPSPSETEIIDDKTGYNTGSSIIGTSLGTITTVVYHEGDNNYLHNTKKVFIDRNMYFHQFFDMPNKSSAWPLLKNIQEINVFPSINNTVDTPPVIEKDFPDTPKDEPKDKDNPKEEYTPKDEPKDEPDDNTSKEENKDDEYTDNGQCRNNRLDGFYIEIDVSIPPVIQDFMYDAPRPSNPGDDNDDNREEIDDKQEQEYEEYEKPKRPRRPTPPKRNRWKQLRLKLSVWF